MNQRAPLLLVFLFLASLLTSAGLNKRLVDQRRTYGITQADPLVNAPPLVVFTTVAFGGFRGIIADLLWIRSARLQQEGRYFELVQLADWITKLEPRFTAVWAYHGWNLTYNISVLFERPEDRWRWVRHGISLLHDDGLRYNPNEPGLLYELAWLFYHKIGGNADDAHLYYKRVWADEMEQLLRLRATSAPARYTLDPERMRQIEQRYGPLEWRLPHAHAIYWAEQSREASHPEQTLMAQRMIYQALTDSFKAGRLVRDTDSDLFVTSPHLDLWPYVIAAHEEAAAHPRDNQGAHNALQYFLRDAIVLLDRYDQPEAAEACLLKLKELDPQVPASITTTEFTRALDLGDPKTMSREMGSALVESGYYRAELARRQGLTSQALQFEATADRFYTLYMLSRAESVALNIRTGLPPREHLLFSALARAFGH